MINYRQEIRNSWVKSEPSASALAALLGLKGRVTLQQLVTRLRQPEVISLPTAIHTDDGAAINGQATLEVRSDGNFVFSGRMHASGLTSFHFVLQVWLKASDGLVIAAQEDGRVFGSDTPGSDTHLWTQPGTNLGLKEHWRSLRASHAIGFHLQAELSGVLGAARDVLVFIVEALGALFLVGPVGLVVFIGNELAGLDSRIGSPNVLEGILVGGGVLLVLGPFGLIPAFVASVAVASLADVSHRELHPWEITFARRVFRNSLDYARLRITNLTRGEGRAFTIPSIGGLILVNMGEAAFNDPNNFVDAKNGYTKPGSLFIHELTHAWQIRHDSPIDLVCGLSENYEYFQGKERLKDLSWQSRSWGGFNNEQQAHIVEDWFEDHVDDPVDSIESTAAQRDPAFRFIEEEIRSRLA